MKEIPLHGKYGEGKFATVSDRRYSLVANHKWFVKYDKYTWYAYATITHKSGTKQRVYMHRFILNAKQGEFVDHRNGNGLCNEDENIRICSRAENQRNTRANVNTSSQYKGVYWESKKKFWIARIHYNGKTIALGCFKNEIEAAKMYDRAALYYHGSFARLNFPEAIPKEDDIDPQVWVRTYISEYRGVSFHKRQRKWNARITIQGKTIYLGSFDNEIDAVNAYDNAVLYYGLPISYLNFPIKKDVI